MARRRLAAVFAHPDDESLFAGGLLAASVCAGADVRLLCLTRGEAGWSRFGERGEALAARRVRELQAACQALGIAPARVLDWPDGGISGLEENGAAGVLEAWLADLHPDAVVSFGPDGGYGHADHVACARLVERAVRALCGPPRLLQTAFEPGTFEATRRRLERFVGPEVLPVPAGSLGSAPRDGEVCVQLDAALVKAKRQALFAHASQLPGADPDRLLAPGLLTALSVRERYQVALGPALAVAQSDDPFGGLP